MVYSIYLFVIRLAMRALGAEVCVRLAFRFSFLFRTIQKIQFRVPQINYKPIYEHEYVCGGLAYANAQLTD